MKIIGLSTIKAPSNHPKPHWLERLLYRHGYINTPQTGVLARKHRLTGEVEMRAYVIPYKHLDIKEWRWLPLTDVSDIAFFECEYWRKSTF